MLIFEKSQDNCKAIAQFPEPVAGSLSIPPHYLRQKPAKLPACSELQVVRHYTGLSQDNFCIDTNMYPLGSCTMKYNPRGVHKAASIPGFLNAHPLSSATANQGSLSMLYHLQQYLCEVTGMAAISLTPMAGSQGELAGVAMIKAYHQSRGENNRNEILIPDAAHGTNPASAAMCGFKLVELKTADGGGLDLDELKAKVGPNTAGIMLTNPSTLGLFMRQIEQIAKTVHEAGGLLYYDGANLNAILGHVRPGDIGFDVMHLNLHKTFATPHGGGGPGAGPVAVAARLKPFLPTPIVGKEGDNYRWLTKQDLPLSIGRMSAFMGNAGILLRAYLYIRLLGKKGLVDVAEKATLNANYLMKALQKMGYTAAYPKRRASHEFIITLSPEKKQFGVNAMDVAKRLLDYGFHSPTTYFPLLVPECLLIEPTETESKQELDRFLAAMKSIREEIVSQPEMVREAPHRLKLRRLDDVRAARILDLNYYLENQF
jgi:glycine dehydrogenase subunit 2